MIISFLPRQTTIFLRATRTIAVDVKTSETIKIIKARFRELAMASDDPPPEIELAGRRLEDGRALMEYHVRKHSTLDVILEPPVPMRVFVRLPAAMKHIMLDVASTDTVHSVKVRVHRREGVAPDRQTLVLAGRPLEDGQRTLSGCGVREGSTLLAIFRPRDRGIRVFVESEAGEPAAIDVKEWYTVRDVQAMGESVLRLPQDVRRRMYRGEALLEEHWTMGDCSVRSGAVIRMVTA